MVRGIGEFEQSGPGPEGRPLGNQSHDFALCHGDLARFGFGLDRREDHRRRRHVDVEQVHRHLRLAVHLEAARLHGGQPAARGPDPLRDLLGDPDVRRVEVDVVGDEERPRPDRRRARRWVDLLGTEVGIGRGVRADALPQSLELSFADVRQSLALGACGGAAIQEDRNGELAPHALGELPRELHAIVHGDAPHRHERHDVGRPHARMLAVMFAEVDARRRHLHGAERRFDRRGRRGHEREHRAVVRCIGLDVEELHARHMGDRLAQGVEHGRIAAFREVRYTLDQRSAHDVGTVVNPTFWL